MCFLDHPIVMYLPIFLKADHLPCLVIGGGKVAAHKAEVLLAAGCDLTLISPELEDSIRDAVGRGHLRWLARGYQNGDCTGFQLVIAATACEDTNRAVFTEASQKGIPVNVVDRPELCTAIFGASWGEGCLTFSVSTGGVAPFMAAAVRDRLAETARGMGEWLEAAGKFRAAVRSAILDAKEKELLYRRFVERMHGRPPAGLPQSEKLEEWRAYLDSTETPG